MDVIAEESKKVNDVVVKNVVVGGFGAFFEKIMSMISVGIFKSPPFSLENIFPSVDFFKNKYFKLASVLIIYLGSMLFVLNAFKPKNTESMIIVYSVCFWIILMAFSIAVVNPYDENSVEYMLKDKVISKIKEIVKGPDDKGPDDKGTDAKGPDAKGPDDKGAKSSTPEPVNSTMTLVMAFVLMVFFGGLKIYSFLYPLGV